MRTVTRSDVAREPVGALLTYEVTGDGFLRHMVRAIVGTLVEVGRGWRDRPMSSLLLLARHARATQAPRRLRTACSWCRVDYD